MELLLFTHDPDYAAAAATAGVDALVVDWEHRGKQSRQDGFDTEINFAGPDELAAIRRAAPGARVICRINNTPGRREEARLAQELGADEILLPMVRNLDEVMETMDALLPGRSLGVMAETAAGLALAPELAGLPLARVYAGLNDLRIERGSGGLFDPLSDGTLDRFRSIWRGRFSAAGATLPEKGAPVPCRLLLGELVRLECDYLVSRRSFRRDIPKERLPEGVAAIRAAWTALRARSPERTAEDREAFLAHVHGRLPCA